MRSGDQSDGTAAASAIQSGDQLHVFAVNRATDGPMTVEVEIADAAIKGQVNGELLTGPAPDAFNDYDAPDRVVAVDFDGVTVRDGKAVLELPPLAVAAVTLSLA